MKKLSMLIISGLLLVGCAQKPTQSFDYTEFEKSKPRSVLMVMPVNNSVDVKAETSVLARATYPLAEKGYYVYPVALVDEVFKQNGLTDGNAIRNASQTKIYDIFGADSIFYVDINEYGTSYKIFDSVTAVSLEGKLVDLKTGKVLWTGSKTISQGVNGNNNSAIVSLLNAAINQIIDTNRDKGFEVAQPTMIQLVYSGSNGGFLPGPRTTTQSK